MILAETGVVLDFPLRCWYGYKGPGLVGQGELSMNHNNNPWPWLDLGTYHKNRCNFPPEQLIPYQGKHVAWNLDGTRILASGDTEEEVAEQLAAAGIDPGQVVASYIDRDDQINL